jgi:hypothetical protein
MVKESSKSVGKQGSNRPMKMVTPRPKWAETAFGLFDVTAAHRLWHILSVLVISYRDNHIPRQTGAKSLNFANKRLSYGFMNVAFLWYISYVRKMTKSDIALLILHLQCNLWPVLVIPVREKHILRRTIENNSDFTKKRLSYWCMKVALFALRL